LEKNMPSLTLSNEQVVELVKQLPQEQKTEIFRFLLLSQWQEWQSLSSYGTDKVKLIARERGYNWKKMTEEEREDFIDEVVHEVP
jgi:transposase